MKVAESEGFEPPIPCGIPDFEVSANPFRVNRLSPNSTPILEISAAALPSGANRPIPVLGARRPTLYDCAGATEPAAGMPTHRELRRIALAASHASRRATAAPPALADHFSAAAAFASRTMTKNARGPMCDEMLISTTVSSRLAVQNSHSQNVTRPDRTAPSTS